VPTPSNIPKKETPKKSLVHSNRTKIRYNAEGSFSSQIQNAVAAAGEEVQPAMQCGGEMMRGYLPNKTRRNTDR